MENDMTYKAKQTVGKFNIGDEVTGLPDGRIKQLLEIGAITEVANKSKSTIKTTAKRTTKSDKDEA